MSDIPKPAKDALRRFEVARADLQSFEMENRDIIDVHKRLLSAATDALDNCKKQYRVSYEAIGSSFGGFTAVSKRAVNADALINIIGLDAATELNLLDLKYVVNKETYEAAVRSGVISATVVDGVEVTTISITAPKL